MFPGLYTPSVWKYSGCCSIASPKRFSTFTTEATNRTGRIL